MVRKRARNGWPRRRRRKKKNVMKPKGIPAMGLVRHLCDIGGLGLNLALPCVVWVI